MTAVTRRGLVIGRAMTADILVDDASVSRRHARVALREDGAFVEDLESANGVFVNGRRVEGTQRLAEGDVIVVGPGVFRLQTGPVVVPPKKKRYSTIDQLWDKGELDAPLPAATEIADALVLADRGAAELLKEGRTAEAEQVLEPQLLAVLERAKASKTSERSAAEAARLALELAQRTRQLRWLDYVLDLYPDEPPPPGVVARLDVVIDGLQARGHEPLVAYVARQRRQADSLDDSGRAGLEALEAMLQPDAV
jgi:pSer/pThr/pTyr-binding forkhead associated (FHA) protein